MLEAINSKMLAMYVSAKRGFVKSFDTFLYMQLYVATALCLCLVRFRHKRHTVRKRLCSSLGILGMFSFPQTRLLWHLQIAVMPPESPPPSPITIRTNLNIITVRRNVISVKLFWWLGWTLICLVYFFSNANLCHINKFSFNTRFSSLI